MLLNITALTKTYTISGKLITALNTVDLTFSENSFTCIVGKSGCGKTTLLRLLSGLEPATSGTTADALADCQCQHSFCR